MIDLYADVLVNNNLLELLSERGRNRVVKNALIHGLRYWHERILPTHFTREGQAKYPNVFSLREGMLRPTSGWKYTDDPQLVDTGEFRDRMLKAPEIRATGYKASIKYVFGTPKNTDARIRAGSFYAEAQKDIRAMNSETRNIIFHSMKGKHISFESARQKVIGRRFQKLGYRKKTKDLMVRGIQAINAEDRKLVYVVMQNFVNDNWKTLGVANYKKVSK